MKAIATAAMLVCLLASVAAQETESEGVESAAVVVARIRAGGWFATSRYRRGDDGALERFSFAQTNDPAPTRFEPLLGPDVSHALVYWNSGPIGFLTMVCHGPGDLLGMTDAEFHFGALGIDSSDAGLRQFLAVPPPPFDGARGRAELLDRLLAIDVLARRGCKTAVPELRVIAANEALPAPLRERARRAVATLGGEPDAVARRHLDPASVRLPVAFDGCVVVDHSRLPELGWLAALGPRLGATLTANSIAKHADGELNAMLKSGAQRMCDLQSELPFGLAHGYGNARIDHSCIVVTWKGGEGLPFGLTWEAAGEFEHEGWQHAELTADATESNPLLAGTMTVTADRVFAGTDRKEGKARPELAAKLGVANDDGIAIRAVMPANSRLWFALAFAELPPADGAELRVTFGDPAVIVLAVDARDEETAAEWVEAGKRCCAELRAERAHLPEDIRQSKELAAVLDAALNPAFSTKGNAAFAVIELRGITREKAQAMLRVLATHAW